MLARSLSNSRYTSIKKKEAWHFQSILLFISQDFEQKIRCHWAACFCCSFLRNHKLKEKWSHFDLKCWVTGGTNIRQGIMSNWRISSQFDSNILQFLGIPGRIFVPPVTQLFRSKWLDFFLQCSNSSPVKMIASSLWLNRKIFRK